jgi:hypothetical protein
MAYRSEHLPVHAPGRAYSADLRSRVSVLKTNGFSNATIATRLGLHRSTVGRWVARAHELEPGVLAAAQVRPRLGSAPLLDRDVLITIADIVSQNPRFRVEDVHADLVHRGLLPQNRGKLVSVATVRRAMLKCSASHRRLRHRDGATWGQRILAERRAFADAQLNESMKIERLLAFDETTIYPGEAASSGWGLPETKLLAPKSPGMGIVLYLSLGVTVAPDGRAASYVHYRAYPPAGLADASEAIFAPDWEVNTRPLCPPFADALRAGRTRDVSKSALVEFLRGHDVSCRVVTSQEVKDASPLAARLFVREDGKGGPLTKSALAAVALRACEVGLAGLARAGGMTSIGSGRKRRMRGTTASFHAYLQAMSSDAQDPANPAFLPDLGERMFLLDNAAQHGALRTTDRRSFVHRLAQERYGMKGVVWTPPLTPIYNPVERANAWVKGFIRKHAPPARPYTDAELMGTIDSAMAALRRSDFVISWFLACGFHFDPAGTAFAPRDLLPSPRERLLADVRGRLLAPGGCTFQGGVLHHSRTLEDRGEVPLLASVDVGQLMCEEFPAAGGEAEAEAEAEVEAEGEAEGEAEVEAEGAAEGAAAGAVAGEADAEAEGAAAGAVAGEADAEAEGEAAVEAAVEAEGEAESAAESEAEAGAAVEAEAEADVEAEGAGAVVEEGFEPAPALVPIERTRPASSFFF